MTTSYANNDLLAGLRQGDHQAFQQLYARYATALQSVIARSVKDPLMAEDLLQDTCVKVWQRFHQFDPTRGSLFTWLMNIARNTAIDYLRYHKPAYLLVGSYADYNDVLISSTSIYEPIGLNVNLRQLLNHSEWQLIDLVYWQGYTQKEAAQRLNLPLSTVKGRIRKILLRLRVSLD